MDIYLFLRHDNKENAPSENNDDTHGHKGYKSKLENGRHKL